MKFCRLLGVAYLVGALCGAGRAEQSVVDFDDLALEADSHWNGPAPNGETVDGPYGPERVGEFVSSGVAFANAYELSYGTWRGFGYSSETDTTTPGHGNQFSVVAGGGHGAGADNYAVAFVDAYLVADPIDAATLEFLPAIEVPFGRSVDSVWITNTTYAALSMRDGDPFAKKFGGASGSDPDWFRVTAYGTNAAGVVLDASAEFYLADFRPEDNAQDLIVSDWTRWDLSALADARRLYFNVTSSDVGVFGMNTPSYFAIDDLTLNVEVPPGDYNGDGAVDAADYTVWRDRDGETVDWRGSGADGDLSGVVDAADEALWRDHYGCGAATVAAPEPTSLTLLFALALFCHAGRRTA